MLAVEEGEEDGENVNCWMDIRSGQYPKVRCHCHEEMSDNILYGVCNVCDV